MSDGIIDKTAIELGTLLADGRVSSVEIMRAHIDRTRTVDDAVGAFISFDEQDALNQATASDERRRSGGALGPLDGIPVAIKDVLAVRGQPLGCASKMLKGFVSPYDAHVVERLRQQGAIVWGRLNMDEFAMGSSTENSAMRATSNPWDLERVPGGSSGGSAASVAALETPLALGSDTGGSVRQPASFCGVVGMKPTYGRISRYGLVAFASSLDQVGPVARSVDDVALLLGAVAGHDGRDSTSVEQVVPDYVHGDPPADRKWKLGVPREYFGAGIDPEVKAAVDRAIEFYSRTGCEVSEVSLPNTEYAVATYYIIATAEASSNLARYDGVRYGHRAAKAEDGVDLYFQSRAEGFGAEVKRRIILGTYVLSSGYYDAYYLRAQKVRTLIRRDFLNAFEKVDALLTPTSPVPAFRRGERTSDPLEMYLCDIYTIGANLAGIPGLSIPCGFTEGGLPIGMQILGRPFGEQEILSLGKQFEIGHEFTERRPDL
ncbi:MAG: Asp-tRNA(Asn)/Glu-tRNA(Gln) amidotransferase GatCAB subunit A [Verrucomicrobia bacterium]|nr:MAG: Asp-tRNA(Asn)/Glu-tRNA(Gln) amidotransferase GatCAB subunit A [Verrucomicrobiota bacterium]